MINRTALVRCILDTPEPVEISQLCELTGLSRPTVTGGLNQLVKLGWVEMVEGDTSTPRGGRPARRFGLSTQSFPVVGVVIRRNSIEAYVADFNMRIITELTRDTTSLNGENLEHSVTAIIADLFSHATMVDKTPSVIVVAVLGVVQDGHRILLSGAFPSLQGTRLHDALADEFSCPVLIENDANLSALAEARESGTPGPLVNLLLGPDIGCGIVIDDELYRGWHGAAGESCASGWHRAWTRLQQAEELMGSTLDVFISAAAGEEGAVMFIEKLARDVAVGLQQVISVMDPRRVVIGGEASLAGEALLKPLREHIVQNQQWETEIVFSVLGIRPLQRGTLLLGQDYVRSVLRSLPEQQ